MRTSQIGRRVEYGFVRWAEDGANMLIRYSFTDNAGAGHSG